MKIALASSGSFNDFWCRGFLVGVCVCLESKAKEAHGKQAHTDNVCTSCSTLYISKERFEHEKNDEDGKIQLDAT